jgi:hypothetical protein
MSIEFLSKEIQDLKDKFKATFIDEIKKSNERTKSYCDCGELFKHKIYPNGLQIAHKRCGELCDIRKLRPTTLEEAFDLEDDE